MDDDPVTLATGTALLLQAGFLVEPAEDGDSAIRMLREGAFDLVITDMVMPGTDGLEILTAAKTCQPSARRMAISAGGQLDASFYLRLADLVGGATTYRKPLRSRDFLETVDQALAREAS